MRRRIELYIDGHLADLSDQGLILYNYAVTDLEKPTAVRNSYSKQITLPGTPANDAIFGHYWRVDRVTHGGGGDVEIRFDAKKRTPFAIYTETGEILQTGYVKLDKVKREGNTRTYAITLYGGLGSFFYALTYNEDGTKRSLADLQYYYWIPSYYAGPFDLSRTIEAETISKAWEVIGQYNPPYESLGHKILNFMPAYNGIPEEFDANKAIVYPSTGACGLVPSELEDEDGQTYYPHQGGGLVEMNKPMTEWKMRDLRSYLQRPILSVKAFLDSVTQAVNNGGYTINWQGVSIRADRNLWLTLRRPVDIDYNAEPETQAVSWAVGAVAIPTFREKSYGFSVDGSNRAADFTLSLAPTFTPNNAQQSNTIYCAWDRLKKDGVNMETVDAACLVQVLAYDGSDNLKYASPVYVLTNATQRKTAADVVDEIEPIVQNGITAGRYSFVNLDTVGFATSVGTFNKMAGSSAYAWSNPISVAFHTERAARVVVLSGWVADEQQASGTTLCGPNISNSRPVYEGGLDGAYQPRLTGSIVFAGGQSRSGITYSQADLLKGTKTPADYLLSLAKMFGWYFTCDEKSKVVTVWNRNRFFDTGESVIDLTSRVDRSKEITITPLYAGSRLYGMTPEAVGGKAQEYKAKYNRTYGDYRVNTGYEFNDEEINLMGGLAFRTAVPWLDRGRDYSTPVYGSDPMLNFEADGYKLTYGDKVSGTYTKEIIPILPDDWNSFSDALPFADAVDKYQFQDGDEKPVSGEDCLVYYKGDGPALPAGMYYQVSDDNDLMYYLNGDKPCWIAAWNDEVAGVYEVRSTIPAFRPFNLDYYGTPLTPWLCFGVPAELYDPIIDQWDENNTLYAWYWRSYLRDLLDQDTKVMKCRVDLRGLKVGPDLLRRFFWYDGVLWALNKITNYSLTTWDPAECEFVQVQDMANYTDGQNE